MRVGRLFLLAIAVLLVAGVLDAFRPSVVEAYSDDPVVRAIDKQTDAIRDLVSEVRRFRIVYERGSR